MTFIKTLSNFNLNVPFTSPNSSEVCSSFTIQIFIWKGDRYLPPTVPVQEITKNNLDQSAGTAKINISDIVNDYLEIDEQDSITTDLLDNTQTAWLKTQVLYVTTDISDIGLPQLIDTRIAVKGYGYGIESENPQPSGTNYLMSEGDYLVSKDSFFNIPILRADGAEPEPTYEVTLGAVVDSLPAVLSFSWTDDIPEDLRSYATIKMSEESDMSIILSSFTGDPNPPRLISLDFIPAGLVYFTVTAVDSNGFSATSNIVSYDNS
jgi:hypothetical protein